MKLIHCNLLSFFRWQYLIITITLFMFIGWHSANRIIALNEVNTDITAVNLWDGFFWAFSGPAPEDNSWIKMLTWFIPHLIYLAAVGDYTNRELMQRGHTILPRIGSRLRWWYGHIITIILVTLLYIFLAILTTLGGLLPHLAWASNPSPFYQQTITPFLPLGSNSWQLAIMIFLMFSSTLITFSLWQIVIAIRWQNSVYGLIIVTIILLLSWLLSNQSGILARWLPGSQSMVWRLAAAIATNASPLVWSIAYNSILAYSAAAVGGWHISTIDILGA